MLSSLPRRALTDQDILRHSKRIKNFRGVFMRNALPKKPYRNESGIVNLDSSDGNGTHWVAYKKCGSNVVYFDSFGNLKPPIELAKYLRGLNLTYNHDRYQKFNSINCGHLCLEFLLQ